MADVTHILQAIDAGDPHAADQLMPLVYDELRRLAAQKMGQEKPGQTLQATALVHEAYLRLVTPPQSPPSEGHVGGVHWNSRGHFFAAAAEAMRRIVIENARRKAAGKHGGGRRRVTLDEPLLATGDQADDLLDLDQALTELGQHDQQAAALVKLRYFAGLGHEEAAESLGITRRAADRLWVLARAWLYNRLH